MWSAIKNDLFEFVQTVQSDTKTTLAKVILDPTYNNNTATVRIVITLLSLFLSLSQSLTRLLSQKQI